MSRFARINVPFGIYHIISRILRGEHLIAGLQERQQYLRLLGRALKNTDAQMLAWCLMSNHAHLVVRSGRDPLSRLMKSVNAGFGGRISGPILGGKEFAVKVLADIAAVDGANRQNLSVDVAGIQEAPILSDVIGTTCAVLGLETWEFEQQPQRRGPSLARRISTYLWVNKFNQPQIEIVRQLKVTTGAVSRWYSKAVREINEIESLCDAVLSKLPSKKAAKAMEKDNNDRTTRFNLLFDQRF